MSGPSPEVEVCRRICFMLSGAENALGIEPLGLGLDDRISRVLHGAMERPALVSAATYRVLYALSPQARQ